MLVLPRTACLGRGRYAGVDTVPFSVASRDAILPDTVKPVINRNLYVTKLCI
jgi:hypothetical protein